jgi:hypothetical protein
MSTLHFTDLAVSRLATPGTYYDQTTPAFGLARCWGPKVASRPAHFRYASASYVVRLFLTDPNGSTT